MTVNLAAEIMERLRACGRDLMKGPDRDRPLLTDDERAALWWALGFVLLPVALVAQVGVVTLRVLVEWTVEAARRLRHPVEMQALPSDFWRGLRDLWTWAYWMDED